MADWKETYEKLKKRKQLIDGKKDFSNDVGESSVSKRNVYTTGAESILQKNVAPTKTSSKKKTTSKKTTTTKKKNTWFSKGAFDDGYDFGDITKTILGTAGDVTVGAVKGIAKVGEGLGDLGAFGVAQVSDWVGADDYAEKVRKKASRNLVDEVFAPVDKVLDRNSVIGEKGDSISEGLGQVGAILATGGIGASAGLGAAGTTALTTGVTGFSSMGSGMGEAYTSGASDDEAWIYGTIKGVGDSVTELLFGGLGKAVNAVGLSKGISSLDDTLAKTVSSKITNQVAKNLTEYGIKAGAEGTEEVLAGLVSAAGKKLTYMSEEEIEKIIEDEQLLEQFVAGALTSGVAQSGIVPGMKQGSLIEANKTGKDFVTGYTQNEQNVMDSLVNEQANEITKQRAIENEVNKAITEKETEQGGILSTKEKTAITEAIKTKIDNGELDISSTKLTNKEISKIRQEVEESMQKGLLDTDKIQSIVGDNLSSNDSYLQRSFYEKDQKKTNFTYDDTKVTNEQEKSVYDSAAKYFNNTTRSHEFVERVAKIAREKGTNYGFINNEELKSLGHDVEGKQVNGLVRTNQDGTQKVLINIDSPKALNTIVGHETTHLLEGSKEYQELQDAIFNYAKEKGDFDTRQQSLNALYEGIENANIDSELTADLVGDYLFTDSQFIDSLSVQKPTVFQKIKELIDDLVVRFTGTKEEKALREVQKKFKEAYRNNTQSVEGTQYAISEETYNKVNSEKQLVHLTNNLSSILDSDSIKGETFSVAVQNKGSKYAGYGQQAIKFKPEILNYVDDTKLFKGDGATNHKFVKESTNKFNSLEELLNDNPKYYNEILFKGDIPLSVIEEVTIPKNSSTELINKLTNAGIKINYYNAAPSYNTTKDVQYSVSDNQGRTLTKEQQEYFKDSKVRDEKGNLEVVYHGSKRAGFTTFFTKDGVSFYTNNSNVAKTYSGSNEFVDTKKLNSIEEANQWLEELELNNVKIEKNNNRYGYEFSDKEYVLLDNDIVADELGDDLLAGYTNEKDLLKKLKQDIIKHFGNEEAGGNYKGYANITNPLIVEVDNNLWSQIPVENIPIENAKELLNKQYYREKGKLRTSTNDIVDIALKNGKYDGVIFKNIIDEGIYNSGEKDNNVSNVYATFNSNQFKTIDNTNPTSDADIRYSLTPDYGMQHRPSTDYGDASNFEENMPDVFEHPEWYFFGSDARSKKAYRESFEALKKVRNNPEGEITIYRATIGDTFNEGDWVSPSKTYAEWHNESNLDGKGKVIELKVKAKDIRFAGDDLNEFGYFPNGVDEYSLSNFNEQRAAVKGNYNVYGEDVKLKQAIAPLQEEMKQLTEEIGQLKEQIAPVQEKNAQNFEKTVQNSTEIQYTQPSKAELDNLMTLQEKGGTEYANTFFELRDKYGQPKLYKGINEYKKAPDTYEAPIKGDEFAPIPQNIVEQQGTEAFNNIDDSNMPGEIEDTTPDVDTYEDIAPIDPFEDRDIDEVGKRSIKAYQYENPEVKPYFQQEAQAMLGDLKNSTKGEKIWIQEANPYSGIVEATGVTGTHRQTTDDIAYLLDKYKYTYAEIEKGINNIIEDNGKENNAVSKRIEFMLHDRLSKGYTSIDGIDIPPNQEYINFLTDKQITEYNEEAYQNYLKTLDNLEIPTENVSNSENNIEIAPIRNENKQGNTNTQSVTKVSENANKTVKTLPKDPTKASSYESIERDPLMEYVERQVGKQVESKVRQQPKVTKQKSSTKNTLNYLFVNRNEAIDRYAKETGNKNIKILADHVNNVQGEISTNINKVQTDNYGKAIGKSIADIFKQAKKTGLSEAFDDYLFHKSNIARHKNQKGSVVPVIESQRLTHEYEKSYPEFKKWSNEVNQYNRNNLQKQVDAGLYTQELADTITKMYDFYVPFFEDIERMYIPDESGEIKIGGTIKRATGGSNRNLLGFEEAMMQQTQSTITAIRKNQLYKEIVNSSHELVSVGTDDISDLYADENGYYLTAKIDGENVTANISEDLYKGLENKGEKYVKDIEQKLSKLTKPLQWAGNVRRNLLTTWSPTFIAKNFIKDVQDAPLNSKYAKDWSLNYPKALAELSTGKGEHVQEFLNMYGQAGILGDYVIDSGISDVTNIKARKKLAGFTKMNEIIELAPRYAEYLASLKNGTSQMEALYNAREVTTNFGRGGIITKALNRNGFTFLNASVQGFNKMYRNFSGENGAKGVANAALKATMFGVAPALFNALAFGTGDEEDEDYKALPDYIKDNYYLIKTDDGEFIRIPKGRMMSVFGSAARRTLEFTQGEQDAYEGFLSNAYSQIGIQNPLESNIFAPLIQAYGSENGTAWYGGDIVPSRLQDVPTGEQYDETTDAFSIWLGEKTGISPYKFNYVLDQYSGGIGDLLLPTITEEATSDGSFLAPIKDQFTANSTSDNKYVSDVYSLSDELYKKSNSAYATEEDALRNQYIYSITSEMGKLYAERREVQNDDSLTKAEKYERAQAIKDQINSLAKEGLDNYQSLDKRENYAIVGDREFNKYTTDDGEERWGSVYEDNLEEMNALGMDLDEKNTFYTAKKEISGIYDNYDKLLDSTSDEDETSDIYAQRKLDIADVIKNTDLTSDQKYFMYDKYYGNTDKINTMKMLDIDADSYIDFNSQTFTADKDSKGDTISGSKKKKVFDYINGMDIGFEQKAILAKLEYNSYDEWNYEIIDYLNNNDNITYEEMEDMLKQMGFEVDDEGNIYWD